MSPKPGEMLLHYRLAEQIGEGGMGIVWRAADTKLDRDVAIKILPPEVSTDAERLTRFEREAKALAALSHPNVAQVHGLEQSEGTHFLVMELVPGEDLAARVARGPLPQTEALEVCLQIAAGLEAAHERGIVHRDLKPANVRLTPDGRVKVLDFGLVKTMDAPSTVDNPSISPTVTSAGTLAGVILGTAAYMSPEQARGGPVDKRTDIWAFGCVMLELHSGTSPFRGRTVPDTLAAVLAREPDLSLFPGDTSPTIVHLIQRCLQKDPRRRLRDIGDAALEIDDCLHAGRHAVPGTGQNTRSGLLPWVWMLLIVAAVAAGAWFLGTLFGPRTVRTAARFMQLSAPLPEGVSVDHSELPPVAISPDGRWVVFVGLVDQTTRLYLRPLDAVEARPIPDTDGATAPFFSPDSRWIAFLQENTLMRVGLAGGAPLRITQLPPVVRGFDWSRPGEIVFARSKRSGLIGLDVEAGTARSLTTVDDEAGEVIHNWAQVLPGDRDVLVTVLDGDPVSYDDARIVVIHLDDGSKKVLVEGGYYGRMLPDDILAYVRAGKLLAVRVDTNRWETVGPEVAILDGFVADANSGAVAIDFSDDGTLAYVPGGSYEWQSGRLVWSDRKGTIEPIIEESRPFRYPRISPDGTRATFTIEEINDDIWIYEFARGAATRLTFEDRNIAPLWRPGFNEISYSAVGTLDISPKMYTVSIDGGSPRHRLLEELDGVVFGESWSPDGMTLSFMNFDSETRFDIMTSGEGATADPVPFLKTRFNEHSSRFSPDGKWIAYASDESGKLEIYIRPFPGPGGKRKISIDGGAGPVWHPQGTELFYLDGVRMMAVDIRLEPELAIGRPRLLFEGSYAGRRLFWVSDYDVSADGQRFLKVQRDTPPEIHEIRIVQGWFDDVATKLAAAAE